MRQKKVQAEHAAALQEDSTVFDYDGVYDAMQEKRSASAASRKKVGPVRASACQCACQSACQCACSSISALAAPALRSAQVEADRKPKYIEKIMKMADFKKRCAKLRIRLPPPPSLLRPQVLSSSWECGWPPTRRFGLARPLTLSAAAGREEGRDLPP